VIGGNVTVDSGATLAPGNSPGTLAVAGNVTLAAGSLFVPEIDGRAYSAAGGAGSYDLLAASGTVSLAGTLGPKLRGISGAATNTFTPQVGDSFVVITAGNVTGSFSSVTQPTDGLPTNSRFDVLYRPTNLALVITPGSYGVFGLANNWSQNATNAAFGLDAVRPAAGTRDGNLQAVFNGIYGLEKTQLRTAITQISGEAYAHALQSLVQTERSTFGAMVQGSCDMSCSAGQGDADESLWINYVGDYADNSADRLSSGYTNRNHGVVGGVTIVSTNKVKFGIAASYVENKVVSQLDAHSQSQSGAGYLYLHYLPTERLVLSTALGVAVADNATNRTIATTAGPVMASSDRQSSTVMFTAKANYLTFKTGPLSVWTNLGVQLSDTSIGRVREQASNQAFALVMGKVDHLSGEAQVGGRVQLGFGSVEAAVMADWIYQIGENPAVSRTVELGNARWNVTGVDLARSGLRVGGQLGARLSSKVSVFGMYQYTDQGRGQSFNRATGGVRINF